MKKQHKPRFSYKVNLTKPYAKGDTLHTEVYIQDYFVLNIVLGLSPCYPYPVKLTGRLLDGSYLNLVNSGKELYAVNRELVQENHD